MNSSTVMPGAYAWAGRTRKEIAIVGGLAIAAWLICLWPCIVNGYPIVYDDDGTYLYFPGSRSGPYPAAYGIFIWALTRVLPLPLALIPVFQAATFVYVLAFAFHVFAGCDLRKSLLLTIAVAALTQLPWLASWLTTDWLGGLGVLALFTFRFARPTRAANLLLFVLFFSAMAATSNLFVLMLAAPLLVLGAALTGDGLEWRRKTRPILLTLLFSFVSLFAYNIVISQKVALAMGSSARLFSKLVDKKVAQPYLAEQCRAGDANACRLSHRIAGYTEDEEFLWGDGHGPALVDQDDAWDDMDGQYQALDMAILRHDPLGAGVGALHDARTQARLLVLSDKGADLVAHGIADEPSLPSVFRHRYPGEYSRFEAALQQRHRITSYFPASFYAAATVFSYAGCLMAMAAAWWTGHRRLLLLAGMVTVTLILSTLVHGGLSLPIPRYTVKSSWLAMFVTWAAVTRLLIRSGRHHAANGFPAKDMANR